MFNSFKLGGGGSANNDANVNGSNANLDPDLMDSNSTMNEAEDEMTTGADVADIAKISVKVPPFWAECPEIWFAQIEAQFANSRITGDKAKFNTVVAAVESNVLQQVSDAILNPPLRNKYDNLKQTIIQRYTQSDHKKLSKLLSNMSLGDKQPSHFLNELKHLGGDRLQEDVLKTIWLNAMPPNMQQILTANTEAPLSTLATIADRVADLNISPGICAVKTNSNAIADTAESELVKAVNALSKKLDNMAFHPDRSRSPQRNRGRSQSRGRSGSRPRRDATPADRQESGLCWYHYYFGRLARKCRQPCKWNQTVSGDQ